MMPSRGDTLGQNKKDLESNSGAYDWDVETESETDRPERLRLIEKSSLYTFFLNILFLEVSLKKI